MPTLTMLEWKMRWDQGWDPYFSTMGSIYRISKGKGEVAGINGQN